MRLQSALGNFDLGGYAKHFGAIAMLSALFLSAAPGVSWGAGEQSREAQKSRRADIIAELRRQETRGEPDIAELRRPGSRLDYDGALGGLLMALAEEYDKSIIFGADVAEIPVQLSIKGNSDFESILSMIEFAARVEFAVIGDEKDGNYSVKTITELQPVRDAENQERARTAREEQTERNRKTEQPKTTADSIDRWNRTVEQLRRTWGKEGRSRW